MVRIVVELDPFNFQRHSKKDPRPWLRESPTVDFLILLQILNRNHSLKWFGTSVGSMGLAIPSLYIINFQYSQVTTFWLDSSRKNVDTMGIARV